MSETSSAEPEAERQPVSRRRFLRLIGLGATASLVAACQSAAPASPTAPAATAAPAPTAAAVPTFARPEAAPSAAASPVASAAPAAQSSAPAQGQITIVQGVDVVTLDPPKSVSLTDQTVMINLYDSLLLRGHDMKFGPGLATSYQNLDPNTWEFKLRQGVKFHNGEDFDANSVKFTIERTLNPATKTGFATWFEGITGVDVVDKYTVHVKTDGPNAALPVRVSSTPVLMLPPQYFQQVGEEAFFQKPVGTGPYRFVEWVKNDHLTIEANPNYWGTPASVKTVTYKPAPEASTRLAMLQTGQADIISNLTPDQAQMLQSDQKLGVASKAGAGVIMYQINGLKNGPLQDKRVRQALNYAVDVNSIVRNVLLGYGKALPGISGPEGECYDGNLQGYAYDPEKAKSLLSQAGASNMTLHLAHPSGRYLLDNEVAQALADQIQKVGITVQLETNEWGRYLGQVTASDPQQRPDLYVILFGTGASTGVPELAWYPVIQGGQTFSTINDPQLNSLLGQASKELDEGKRCQDLTQVQQTVEDLAPRIFMYQQNVSYGYNKAKITFDPRIDEYIWLPNDVKLV